MNKDYFFPLVWQVMRFGLVGILAALTHISVVTSIVQFAGIKPLIANVYGFMIAFQVSYWGHRLWTFKAKDTSHRLALPKLLLIQLANFGANELLFYVFLSLHFSYQFALFIVLSILPCFTFISSKLWVFPAESNRRVIT